MTTGIEYRQLINRITKIDRKAAIWLMRKAPLCNMRSRDINLAYSNKLLCVMYWSATPQGHKYWSNISEQLGE